MRTRWLWLGLFLWLSPGAWAWVDEGHDLVARIAVRHLEPSTLTALQRLLEAHPHGVKTLEEASYWPDRVRDVPRYHRESWHFVNIPYFADSSGLEVRYPGRDILYALNLNTRRLKNRELSERERAIALCWVTHLIGDIHQPLHCAQLFNRHFPGGDRGGNDFKVRLREREITLHLLWDMQGGFFLDGANRFRLAHLSRALDRELELGPTDPHRWARESHELAKSVAYQGVEPGQAVTPEYLRRVRQTAEVRTVLAGRRLARYLNRVFGSRK